MNDSQTSSSPNPPAGGGFRISDEPVVRSNRTAAPGNSALARGRPAASDVDLLYVIARDPKSLFVYWDLNWKRLFAGAGLSPCQVHLRIYREDDSVESTSEINPFRGHHYAEVGAAGTGYYCELGCLADDEWTRLLRSGKAATPENRISDDLSAEFATLPLHMSFQRMLDVLRETQAEGAPLAQSVAELQATAPGPGKSRNGTNGASSFAVNALRQAPGAPEPTAEQRAQWQQLAKEFGESSWGGASGSGFGGSSPA